MISKNNRRAKYFVLFFVILFLANCTNLSNLQKPNKCETYVIAHRGAHIGIPENTLATYKKAIDLGCDFVEMDMRRTKDGKFVSVHNSKIDAYVKGITGNVNDFNLAELKLMDIFGTCLVLI